MLIATEVSLTPPRDFKVYDITSFGPLVRCPNCGFHEAVAVDASELVGDLFGEPEVILHVCVRCSEEFPRAGNMADIVH